VPAIREAAAAAGLADHVGLVVGDTDASSPY
jgi:hypothetical protein